MVWHIPHFGKGCHTKHRLRLSEGVTPSTITGIGCITPRHHCIEFCVPFPPFCVLLLSPCPFWWIPCPRRSCCHCTTWGCCQLCQLPAAVVCFPSSRSTSTALSVCVPCRHFSVVSQPSALLCMLPCSAFHAPATIRVSWYSQDARTPVLEAAYTGFRRFPPVVQVYLNTFAFHFSALLYHLQV